MAKKKRTRKRVAKKTAEKKAAKKKTTNVLTVEQLKKIRKLVTSKDAANVQVAIQLLQSAEATSDNWSDAFSTRTISLMVNTWDLTVWKPVVAALSPYPSLQAEFREIATKRFARLTRANGDNFLENAVREITPQLLTIVSNLASCRDHLSLQVKSLSDVAAESLANFTGDLTLWGMTSLSDEAIGSLGRHKGSLSLYGLTSLSDAAAESLSTHDGEYLNLEDLRSPSDAATESLSTHEGQFLNLDGLTSLSDAAAQSLCKYKGGWLYLNGLRSLSDAAAESLSKYGGELDLRGLTSLSSSSGHVDLATKLSRQEDFSLENLASLSDAAAESLSKHKGPLMLDSLAVLSDVAAKSLSRHKSPGSTMNGYTLHLDGLKILSDAAAESLSNYKPVDIGWVGAMAGHITLAGLTTLSDQAVESLIRAEAKIDLSEAVKTQVARVRRRKNRKTTSPGTGVLSNENQKKIKKLVKTRTAENIALAVNLLQSVEAPDSEWKTIFSSSTLSLLVNTWDVMVWNEVAAGLKSLKKLVKEFESLVVDRFMNISSKEMDQAGIGGNYWGPNERRQAFLAAFINDVRPPLVPIFHKMVDERNLDLSSIQTLTPEAAEVIADCYELDLSGFKVLPDEIASILGNCGTLNLSGLTSLSDAAAGSLRKTTGEWLDLSGLATLSPAAAKSLSQYKGSLDLSGLKSLSADAAERISRYRGRLVVSSLQFIWDAK